MRKVILAGGFNLSVRQIQFGVKLAEILLCLDHFLGEQILIFNRVYLINNLPNFQ